MKSGTAAIAALLALSAPVLAPAASPSDQPAPATQAVPPSGNVQTFDKNAAQVSENLGRMQKQMDEIQQTRDPAERQKLLREHQLLMQETMGMMGQMLPGGMEGCCAQNGGGPHHRGGP